MDSAPTHQDQEAMRRTGRAQPQQTETNEHFRGKQGCHSRPRVNTVVSTSPVSPAARVQGWALSWLPVALKWIFGNFCKCVCVRLFIQSVDILRVMFGSCCMGGDRQKYVLCVSLSVAICVADEDCILSQERQHSH